MLTLRGIITLIVLIVLFALAVVWISKQGGWKGEGRSEEHTSELQSRI